LGKIFNIEYQKRYKIGKFNVNVNVMVMVIQLTEFGLGLGLFC